MGSVVRGYKIFPVIFGAILLILTVVLFFVNEKAGLYSGAALLLYIVAALIFLSINNRNLERGLIRFARQYGGLEGELINDFPIPYVITDPDGRIVAYNKIFGKILDTKEDDENICDVFQEINIDDLAPSAENKNVSIIYDKRNFRLCIKHMKVTHELIESKIALLPRHELTLNVIYMFDETEVVNLMKSAVEEQMAIGSIYVDNYDELISRNIDIQKNINSAMLDNVIGVYFSNIGGIVRKLEKDRYFVVFKRKYLNSLQRNKFEVLDQVRALDFGEGRSATLSIGIGAGEDYSHAEKAAQSGLELALGRGGDQVVVKEGERTYFYGGKTKQVEKNTRVKSRVKAMALRDVMISKERIIIMGHKNADIDSLASSVGIYKAAKALGRYAYIVFNWETNIIQPIMDAFMEDDEYAQGVFISPDTAMEYVDKDTALVIVDVNKPDIFEVPELVQHAGSVVLIDHHLQSGERIDNLVLSYVEPTASSASEMVTEMLQYIADSITLRKIEAVALYSGILIDTDSFTKNTGFKTFEAAAFLRKNGADIQKANSLFRDSLDTARIKAKAMETVEIIAPGFVTAVTMSEGVSNPTVIAAQVANELLDIQDVKASFVMTNISGKIYISARSVGTTNVQLIMEKMGGGGHLNMAGCQMEDISVEEAQKALRITLMKMLDDKDIE